MAILAARFKPSFVTRLLISFTFMFSRRVTCSVPRVWTMKFADGPRVGLPVAFAPARDVNLAAPATILIANLAAAGPNCTAMVLPPYRGIYSPSLSSSSHSRKIKTLAASTRSLLTIFILYCDPPFRSMVPYCISLPLASCVRQLMKSLPTGGNVDS